MKSIYEVHILPQDKAELWLLAVDATTRHRRFVLCRVHSERCYYCKVVNVSEAAVDVNWCALLHRHMHIRSCTQMCPIGHSGSCTDA